MRRLQEVYQSLEADIQRGLFTPFLGPGVSSLRPRTFDSDSYPWRELRLTFSAISSRLQEEKSRNFLWLLAEQRLSLPRTIASDADAPKELTESMLVKLQAELVRSTVSLTRYFGWQLTEESQPILDVGQVSVDFDLCHEEANDCVAHLLKAADLAQELDVAAKSQRESPFLIYEHSADRHLESKWLYLKLLTLVVGLIGPRRNLYEHSLERHTIGGYLSIITDRESWSDFLGKLRLDAIEWLSDLLWYTIRYWLPFYPTSSELAFELSLITRGAPLRRPELTQAAQALEADSAFSSNSRGLAAVAGTLARYCELVQERQKLRNGPSALYCAIAVTMLHQYERYRLGAAGVRSNLRDRFRTVREEPSSRDIAAYPAPIVFASNFDMTLEKIFEANEAPFHIVFPVVKGGPEDEVGYNATTWMVRTVYPGTDRIYPDEDWESFCQPNYNGIPQVLFKGPIIVKLNGSPGLTLSDDLMTHRIVLSETNYFEFLQRERGVPPWLERQLTLSEGEGNGRRSPRSLWFLGYPISEWSSRLNIYSHCREHGRLPNGRRNTVDMSTDLYQISFLRELMVNQWSGDLRQFPVMILEALGLDSYVEISEKCRRLLLDLRAVLQAKE